jgi:hypothetical protein
MINIQSSHRYIVVYWVSLQFFIFPKRSREQLEKVWKLLRSIPSRENKAPRLTLSYSAYIAQTTLDWIERLESIYI